jgi:hypothetical protein
MTQDLNRPVRSWRVRGCRVRVPATPRILSAPVSDWRATSMREHLLTPTSVARSRPVARVVATQGGPETLLLEDLA